MQGRRVTATTSYVRLLRTDLLPLVYYYVHVSNVPKDKAAEARKFSPRSPKRGKALFRKLRALKLNQPGIGELNPCARWYTKLRLRPLSMVRARICTTSPPAAMAAAAAATNVRTKKAHEERTS
jgi:hypothetical protein